MDREHLLAVIEVGFGDLISFNHKVAAIVRRSLMINAPPLVKLSNLGVVRV
jgi:hypothetical protein